MVIKRLIISAIIVLGSFFVISGRVYATTDDRDGDGFSNDAEVQIYGTNPNDANSSPGLRTLLSPTIDITKLKGSKRIEIDLSDQRLRYYVGTTLVGDFFISSGLAHTPTPTGVFAVQAKIPSILYQGANYNYPNTKWNLRFLPKYYIHGAYWHNNFGTPMSRGCINVSYADMPKLYEFANVGTKIIIQR